jgi:SSS family solute:Na+ symporter
MTPLDWLVLAVALVGMVAWGVWKGGRSQDTQGFLLAGHEIRWGTVAISVMATQASAITFLSTPGQAYADGMRFVQFYLGLPIAMVVLSLTAVPLYHRMKVYTAYEYLESRFDAKTRTLTAFLFLVQRGLAAGLTIFAPALILSVILGWDIGITVLLIGALVVVYTTSGGTRAVSRTQTLQFTIIWVGMAAAFVALIAALPADVSFVDALRVAGAGGRLKAIDFSWNPNDRYTLWSGLLGGFFLQMSYFGTDQSQVQRYLSGRSVGHSRMGLLLNGLIKVPMQFVILFIGATVFAFYQFTPTPVSFNPVRLAEARSSAEGARFGEVEMRYDQAVERRGERARELATAFASGDEGRVATARTAYSQAAGETATIRREALAVMREADPRADTNDVFLSFVVRYLPAGLVGLLLAVVFAASMSACSAELNALASTIVVDVYRRLLKRDGSEQHYVRVSRLATVAWGGFAVLFASYANRLGSLVEAVNILGSLFYGTILGVFLTGFLGKRACGTAVFLAAIAAEGVVLACFALTTISFLWYNVIGCAVVVLLAHVLQSAIPRRTRVAADVPRARVSEVIDVV